MLHNLVGSQKLPMCRNENSSLRRTWQSNREWIQVFGPCTSVGDLGDTPRSWLQPVPSLAFAQIWGVNQRRRNLHFFLPLCVARPLKWTNKSLRIYRLSHFSLWTSDTHSNGNLLNGESQLSAPAYLKWLWNISTSLTSLNCLWGHQPGLPLNTSAYYFFFPSLQKIYWHLGPDYWIFSRLLVSELSSLKPQAPSRRLLQRLQVQHLLPPGGAGTSGCQMPT